MDTYGLALLYVASFILLATGIALAAATLRPAWIRSLCQPVVDIVDQMLLCIPPSKLLMALGHTILGASIFGVLLFLMASFFPTYANTLETMLKLAPGLGGGAAKSVMGSTAMAGVFLHFIMELAHKLPAISYQGSLEDPAPPPDDDGDDQRTGPQLLNVLWPVVLLLTFCLWVFQGLVFAFFFGGQTKQVPLYVAGALFGIFASFIETLGFWLAVRFLFPSIVVWPVYVLSLPARVLLGFVKNR